MRTSEAKRKSGREHYARIRKALIEAYGSQCVCCGETEPKFLTLDHINDDGAEERRWFGTGRQTATKFYRMLRNQGWPKDRYQLLCYNCNSAKAHGGCPHQLPARSGVEESYLHPSRLQ